MKVGDKVKYIKTNKIGTCQGPKTVFGVKWIQVDWADGTSAIVLEKYLEVISESR